MAIAVVALSACGSSTSYWSIEKAQHEYTQVIAPSDNAMRAVGQAVVAGDPAAIAKACRSAIGSFDRLVHDLAAGTWPMRAQGQIISVTTMGVSIRSDLQTCSVVGSDGAAMRAVTDEMAKDVLTEKAASDFVRSDLGLITQ